MRICRPSAILFALTLTVYSLQAQTEYYGSPYPAYPSWQGRASTVEESQARGAADLVRAAGDFNLRNSQAAQNYETARSQDLDNRLKYAETYYEKRRLNEEYKASQRKPLTQEQVYRRAIRKPRNRLTSQDLNPITGEINWPVLLLSDEFGVYRKKLEGLFASRASQDRFSYDTFAKIQDVGAEMHTKLDEMVKKVSATDYIRARRFLETLMYEAKLMTS